MRVSSTDMQNNFGKYLKFAEAGEEIIVTKNGKDVAKLTAFAGRMTTPSLRRKRPDTKAAIG